MCSGSTSSGAASMPRRALRRRARAPASQLHPRHSSSNRAADEQQTGSTAQQQPSCSHIYNHLGSVVFSVRVAAVASSCSASGEQHSEAACSGHSAQAALERTQQQSKQQPSSSRADSSACAAQRRAAAQQSSSAIILYACVRVHIACSSKQNIVCVRLN